jgi:hypothetical protein
MAQWPTIGELLEQIGTTTPLEELPSDRQTILNRALAAAIELVKTDTTGDTEEEPAPEPSEALSQAALLLAVRVVKAPDAPFGIAAVFDSGGLYKATNDPDYRKLLKGSRSNFGVA